MKYYLLSIILTIFIVTLVNIIYTYLSKTYEAFESNKISIINLVLYSNDKEYDKMYDLTKSYYSRFTNVKTIYYKFNENNKQLYELYNDILDIKGSETYIPGILDKTVKAIQYVYDNYTFDYIIRSNISTIVNFDLLTQYLEMNPIQYGGGLKNTVYGGDEHADINGILYASGTSIILSKNIIQEFVEKKQYIRNDLIDDVSIGVFMNKYMNHIEQKYIPEERFIFIPDEKGDNKKIVDLINKKNFIFYRNRQPDRNIDVKQMKIIIDYLKNI